MPPPPPSVPRWRPSADSPLDKRVHAFRPDLADAALRGRVEAERFVEPRPLRCRWDSATVYSAADLDASADSELVAGETFLAVEVGETWAWGYCAHDRYVGYVLAGHFDKNDRSITHRVVARRAPLFTGPDIKARITDRAPIGSLVAETDTTLPFIKCCVRGYLHVRHVARIGEHATDPVEVASRLTGEPYVWGGRGGQGVDCSGLVQVALGMCGIAAPRDSDQQMAALGREIDRADARRGDLVFFPGHVGIMADREHLLHANAHWMTTLIEPLADVVARLERAHARPILAVKRLD